jgi:hypothetical protein
VNVVARELGQPFQFTGLEIFQLETDEHAVPNALVYNFAGK